MKIALASDHAGFPLKQHLVDYLKKQGHEVHDLGTHTPEIPSDYPDAAHAVGLAVVEGRAERGIVACGSGIGACIAANKIDGVYASVVHDVYSAHQGVEHDQMNVICVGSRIIGTALAEEIATTFLNAKFSGEARHQRRFNKLKAIEEERR
jgi:ribose 5-phosphate isomerase B